MGPLLQSSAPQDTSSRATGMPKGVTASSKASSTLSVSCWLWQRLLGLTAAMAVHRGELKIRMDRACLTPLPSAKEENSPDGTSV